MFSIKNNLAQRTTLYHCYTLPEHGKEGRKENAKERTTSGAEEEEKKINARSECFNRSFCLRARCDVIAEVDGADRMNCGFVWSYAVRKESGVV